MNFDEFDAYFDTDPGFRNGAFVKVKVASRQKCHTAKHRYDCLASRYMVLRPWIVTFAHYLLWQLIHLKLAFVDKDASLRRASRWAGCELAAVEILDSCIDCTAPQFWRDRSRRRRQ